MDFKLTVNMDNAAFATKDEGFELARILRRLAKHVEGTGITGIGDEGKSMDVNGNTVARWEVTA